MKQFDVYLRKKVTELNLYLKELPIRHDIGARHNMVLWSDTIYLLIGKLIRPTKNRMVLRTAVQPTHAEVFNKIPHKMILNTSANAHVGVSTSDVQDRLILRQDSVGVASEEFNGGKTKFTLRSSDVYGELWTIIRGSSKFILSTNIGTGWLVHKYPTISHVNVLSNTLAEFVTKFIYSAKSRAVLNSVVNIMMARYRILEEMDDLSLEDFDDMSLEDIDFVEIE